MTEPAGERVPHHYPLAVRSSGLMTAIGLLIRSLPYALMRFAVLLAFSAACIVWLIVAIGGSVWTANHIAGAVGVAWFVTCVVAAAWFWTAMLRYLLHLIECGHVAVLTDLIVRGQVGNGSESMFAYGKRAVTERFGQVNALFALNLLVRGVVNAVHATIEGVGHLLPIPGIESIGKAITAIVRAATRYMDKVIFSYNLASAGSNPWRTAQDGLVYYAQNAKPLLKQAVWIVVLDYVLSAAIWIVLLVPAAALVAALPASVRQMGGIVTMLVAVLFALAARGAFLKPVFLIMIMTRFHVLVEHQAINAEWVARLDQISVRFRTLGEKAAALPAALCLACLALIVTASGCSRAPQNQQAPAAATKAAPSSAAAPPSAPPTSPPAPAVQASVPDPESEAAFKAAWHGFIPEAGPVVTGHAVNYADLSESEQKYGVAPTRGPGVVYQDQVVLMEHGDKAIKSWAANGLEWTLDGSDPRVSALKEDDIVFATTRCVGRVLKLTRTGSDVSVILGPVQLTDIIKQGNFTYEQPLDLNTLTAVEMPEFPGAIGSPLIDQMNKTAGGSGLTIDHVAYYVVTPRGDWRPMRTIGREGGARMSLADAVTSARPSIVRASYVEQEPLKTFNNVLSARACFIDCGGLGVRMSARQAGLNLDITVVFHLDRPRLYFNAGIYNTGFQAQIGLTGAAGFEMSVQGTTDPDFTANLKETGAIPVDLIVPMGFGPVPLELHYHQDVSLATAFSAKTSLLRSRMDVKLYGLFGFTYQGGQFRPWQMQATPSNSLSGDIGGVSMGINSIVVAIDQRLLAGLGAGGFAVGPYVGLTSTITALKQATEAANLTIARAPVADCRQGTFGMQLNGGIGYALPKPIVKIINFFLKIVQAKPISDTGTLARLPPVQVVRPFKSSMPPNCAGQ